MELELYAYTGMQRETKGNNWVYEDTTYLLTLLDIWKRYVDKEDVTRPWAARMSV
jgi:hypothetical protein